MELPIVDRSHRAGSIHRQITTLTLFSNVTSLTAFAYCIPLSGKKTLLLTPCVSILTLLHHFALLLERRRCCVCMTQSLPSPYSTAHCLFISSTTIFSTFNIVQIFPDYICLVPWIHLAGTIYRACLRPGNINTTWG